MVRLFIAAEPSKEIRQNIYECSKTLAGADKLTFSKEEQLHITLKFLGEVPENKIPQIKEAMKKISSAPYTIKVSKTGTFGKPPRVIKAEVKDENSSENIARQLDELLSKIGFARENKKFSPHITIARVKEYSPSLAQKIKAISEEEFGSCTVSSILLKKSILTPQGPIYSTIFEVRL